MKISILNKFSREQIIFLLVLILVAMVAAFIGMQIAGRVNAARYVAVYLETGEIYFGRISWFPSVRMTNVMMLQRAQDPAQGWAIEQFTNAAWRPVEPLHLNRDKIVFWTYVDPASPVVQAIEGRVVPQVPQAPPPGMPGEGMVPQLPPGGGGDEGGLTPQGEQPEMPR